MGLLSIQSACSSICNTWYAIWGPFHSIRVAIYQYPSVPKYKYHLVNNMTIQTVLIFSDIVGTIELGHR